MPVPRLDELTDAELDEIEARGAALLRELDDELDRRQRRREAQLIHAAKCSRKAGWSGLRAGGWGLIGAVLGTTVAGWLAVPFAAVAAAEAAYAFFQTQKAAMIPTVPRLALPGETTNPEEAYSSMSDEDLRRSGRNLEMFLRIEVPHEWRRRGGQRR